MSKFLGFFGVTAVFGLFAFLMFLQKVPAGNVGILVHLLGTDSGVNSEEVGVGRTWVGINDELYLFPTFTQNYVWTRNEAEGSRGDESISFQTSNGLNVNADIGISYRIDPTKVNIIFQTYRRGVDEITDIFLRNMVRDALNEATSTMDAEAIYGSGRAALLDNVQASVVSQVEEIGIVVEKIYWIGSLRLPTVVTESIEAKKPADLPKLIEVLKTVQKERHIPS